MSRRWWTICFSCGLQLQCLRYQRKDEHVTANQYEKIYMTLKLQYVARYVPASAAYFRFLDSNGEGVPDPSALFASPDLGAHQFNKKVVFHRFCKSCGTHILAHPVERRTQRPNIVAVNIRTVDGFDLKKVVNVLELDGRKF